MRKPDGALRVMTWNLWWRFGDWEQRQRWILETITAVEPDVILLQEVWSEANGRNQAADLANALGYQWTSAKATDIGDLGLCNAVLSRWPLVDTGSIALTTSSTIPEGRCAVYSGIDSPLGRLFVTTAHLTWQRNNSVGRQAQVRDLLTLIKEHARDGWPPILGGDFNADPDSDEIRMLTGRSGQSDETLVFQDAWEHGGDGTAGITWTPKSQHFADSRYTKVTAMPWLRRRLDYLFVGLPDGRPTNTDAIQVENTWLVGNNGVSEGSDHYGVVADIRPQRLG